VELSSRAGASARFRISAVQALWWLAIAAIAAGVLFRFSNVGVKTFWGDETYTLLRVSGYTQRDLDRLSNGQVHSIDAVRFFQRPHFEKNILDTANSLAVDEPQHAPLYFAAEQLWMKAFGDSATAARSLSVLAGTIALIGMFWLGSELFPDSKYARWIGVAIFAVSPFHVAYSHEAREYSAWAAITIISTAALLRAARQRTFGWWLLYTAIVVAGCYTDLIFVYVIAAHGLALLCVKSTRTLRTLGWFCASAAAALIAYSPWLLAFYQHRSVLAYDIGWAANAMPLQIYLGKLAFNASTVFFDLTFVDTKYAVVAALVLCVVVAALVVVARSAPPLARAVIFALLLTTSLPFVVQDALTHTFYATGSRYFVPAWIAVELAVTFACAVYAERSGVREGVRIAWRSALVALLVLGSVSNAVGIRQSIWWDNHDDATSQSMADAVNVSPAAPLLLVKPDNVPRLLVLSRYLRDDASFEIITPAVRRLPAGAAGSVYLLSPDDRLRMLAMQATSCPLAPVPLDFQATPADELHASLSKFRGGVVDALWRPQSRNRSECK
jgi:uncharacterized membrane protein